MFRIFQVCANCMHADHVVQTKQMSKKQVIENLEFNFEAHEKEDTNN